MASRAAVEATQQKQLPGLHFATDLMTVAAKVGVLDATLRQGLRS